MQSAGTEVAANAEPEMADPEPRVRLEPFEAGLAVAIMVEPIPESGIFFEPGTGATTVFTHRDGRNVQAHRDLAGAVERGEREATGRLRRLVAPFLLRRIKTEVLDDLPERTEITLRVPMSPDEAALYEALRERAVAELEAAGTPDSEFGEGAQRVQLLAHLTRLRLACCHPRLVLDDGAAPGVPASSKLQVFADTLAELMANKHEVLVFSQFVRHLKLVEEYLVDVGISHQYLDGATPAKSRRVRIDDCQAGRGDVGRCLSDLAQSRRSRAQPYGGRLCRTPRSLVESRRRGPGVGSGPPDWPAPPGDDLPTGRRGDDRGADRRPAPAQARPRRKAARSADAPARLSADELLALLRRPLVDWEGAAAKR